MIINIVNFLFTVMRTKFFNNVLVGDFGKMV